MLDLFIFETQQLTEQLEQSILQSEKAGEFTKEEVNEIFRVMHTIKGSSAMMLFNNISGLAHSVEDMFYIIREGKCKDIDFSEISDLVLSTIYFVKTETEKIANGKAADGECGNLLKKIKRHVSKLKGKSGDKPESGSAANNEKQEAGQLKFYISPVSGTTTLSKGDYTYEAVIYFEDGCEMENVRAFSLIHNLKEKVEIISYNPPDILENENSIDTIRNLGFRLYFKTDIGFNDAKELFSSTAFLSFLELSLAEDGILEEKKEITRETKKSISLDDEEEKKINVQETKVEVDSIQKASKQNFISVNLVKLDKLMDLVGELVISEAMVTRNPELVGLHLEGFSKASRQLSKLTSELQDIVMSIRMVPLTATFQKMNRIIRDMSKKLEKEVQLEIIGEDTEVDKNTIENISDPLMHLIRNSLDHGLESSKERVSKGKPKTGKVVLEAKNSGGDVWITVKDDGKGLSKEKILAKAREHGLVKKPESELTDREIYSFIMLPGFSTKEKVTEFSGRGVGLDVVVKNVEKIGGSVLIDSTPGVGTTFSIKIPLTLAIIDGMVISVGKASYVVPTVSIQESFRPKEKDIITDPDGNEMILIRGVCYPILRLHELFNVNTQITNMTEGIMMMVQNEERGICLFADALIGEQQVVVKTLPKYIKKVNGIAGCTLLGDGSISLIIDTGSLVIAGKGR